MRHQPETIRTQGHALCSEFSARADPRLLTEWMDEPCSEADLRSCLRSLDQINAVTLGYRPTLTFLESLLPTCGFARPLHILDVGAGGGGTLRRIARWARRRHVAVQLTGIDLNPVTTRVAEEFSVHSSPGQQIRWRTANVFELTPDEPVDVVLSTLVAHHMTDEELVRFLRWMEHTARCGWFVNDLLRSWSAAHSFGWLARLMHWHRFVQHDGPVSFRRAFVEAEWRRYIAEAGLPLDGIEIEPWRPGRLCVARRRANQGDDGR